MPGSDKCFCPSFPYIQVENVTKHFGDIIAVSNVSFCLQKGEILGLFGSDGAGKTTLLRMMATMIPLRPEKSR